MLDLSKTVLEKVSFDKTLFRKELTKAIERIQPNEKTQLRVWCLDAFGEEYQPEIAEAFNNIS
jgi:hypothetical protein